jgi:hypothetical protein
MHPQLRAVLQHMKVETSIETPLKFARTPAGSRR